MVVVYTLQAFSSELPHGGNEAAVVLNADSLSIGQMQRLATEIGFSETAFISHSRCADFKVRFFTPNNEVDLCGHATIASFFLMKVLGLIDPYLQAIYTEETKAGVMNISVGESDTIRMTQNLPKFYEEEIDKSEVAYSLGISPDDIDDDLPIQIVSTGLKDIIVPVKSIAVLDKLLQPKNTVISQISEKHGVTGYHVFSFTDKQNTIACRNFAPLYDIAEESATGTSNAALACYLHKYKNFHGVLVCKQGYAMQKPSLIHVDLSEVNGVISEVKVGGRCSNILKREIDL